MTDFYNKKCVNFDCQRRFSNKLNNCPTCNTTWISGFWSLPDNQAKGKKAKALKGLAHPVQPEVPFDPVQLPDESPESSDNDSKNLIEILETQILVLKEVERQNKEELDEMRESLIIAKRELHHVQQRYFLRELENQQLQKEKNYWKKQALHVMTVPKRELQFYSLLFYQFHNILPVNRSFW